MNAQPYFELARNARPALTQLYVTYFRLAERSDLTGPQLTILSRLKSDGAARISELAKREGIRMPTASNALHQLESRGLVERVRDNNDRRGVRVQLTEQGAVELERVGEERIAQLADMFSTLEDEEIAAIEEIVPIINRLAERYTAQTRNGDK
ncbi:MULTISPECIES: MarR family transcriptional regulator [Corynebacterium]|uniref:MarR family transcriptional regulator n=1 Tax=Corynebacterium TaxID=1716 RepID=UPI00124CEBA9|nr:MULTISPECIES: MarR family transcriptional regulator [Corynebacterium]MBV7282372.1 MarR family transcriptional regulator [Corynebacterium sp. TAE3-ERU30]MBV7302281.1 MarR family transcriptional regulator [Corynebacterium sp. TAE3-ERU2]